MVDRLSPVQVANVRWVLLQTVHAGGLLGATEQMCTDAVLAGYHNASLETTRRELEYLESAGLVELKKPGVLPWTAKLTNQGRDVVDYIADAPDGILRPHKSHLPA